MDISEWSGDAPDTSAVTIEQVDNLLVQYAQEREDYEKTSKESKLKHGIMKTTEATLINTLKALGKKSYKVDGLGGVSVITKNSVRVPQDTLDKRKLFDWIAEKHGPEVLDSMLSINHNKLNGFFNQEVEINKDNPLFKMPGLDDPTPSDSIQFRRTK